MLRLDRKHIFERLALEAARRLNTAKNPSEISQYTHELCGIYKVLGDYHFDLFHRTFNFLDLTHAEVYFQLAIDTISTIQEPPSHLLLCGFFATQSEKRFHQSSHSTSYIAAINEYRSIPKVPEEMPYRKEDADSEHVFKERPVKMPRILPPQGYVDPVAVTIEEANVDAMEIEDTGLIKFSI